MIYRILNKVFNVPWLVQPEVHYAIQKAVTNKMAGVHADSLVDETGETPLAYTDPSSFLVVPVFGIIGSHLSLVESLCGGFDLQALSAQLKQAASDDNVKGVVLWFNSPGGTVSNVRETAELIAEVDGTKPVYAFTDGQMCSAAYWLASQCRAILASPSSDVGSIGVYMALLDETAALEKEGFKVNAISAGKFKLSGASFKTLTDEERAMFQDDVNRIYNAFTSAIKAKRQVDSAHFEGQVYDGEEAVTYGLVDGLANDIDEALTLFASQTPA
jgi:protease-4